MNTKLKFVESHEHWVNERTIQTFKYTLLQDCAKLIRHSLYNYGVKSFIKLNSQSI